MNTVKFFNCAELIKVSNFFCLIKKILASVNLSQKNTSILNHKTNLKSKNIFSPTKHLKWTLAALLAVIILSCEYSGEKVEPESRLDKLKGEMFGVILHYGDALNADGGGWYSVEIKNPRNNWRDIIIWETEYSHKNTEEKNRNYTFMFHDDNFREQYYEWEKYKDEYATQDSYVFNVVDGTYDVIIRNSFGYEKKAAVYAEIKLVDVYYNVTFNPEIKEFTVP